MKSVVPALFALAMSFASSGCSTPSADSLAQRDPWEATNRDIFTFDVWAEDHIARPVDKGYRAVVPAPARAGVHNLTTNLHEPIVLANDVLQGHGGSAVKTLGRIVINTTIGIGGLIDVAGKFGIPHHDNDFGITLGKGGIAEGSYLVLPFLGPLPHRDLLGTAMEVAASPFTYAQFSGKDTWLLALGGLRVLDLVDMNRDQFETIERSSIDFYATTRNLYRQRRDAQIRGEDSAAVPLPEF
jgi:phospholipid-binding lipoprotein MlaA